MTGDPAALSAAWTEALTSWAIPPAILEAAPESPYGFPSELFARRGERAAIGDGRGAPTPTASRALEALAEPGTVLDVGVGGGATSFPLATRCTGLIVVDGQDDMLEAVRPSERRYRAPGHARARALARRRDGDAGGRCRGQRSRRVQRPRPRQLPHGPHGARPAPGRDRAHRPAPARVVERPVAALPRSRPTRSPVRRRCRGALRGARPQVHREDRVDTAESAGERLRTPRGCHRPRASASVPAAERDTRSPWRSARGCTSTAGSGAPGRRNSASSRCGGMSPAACATQAAAVSTTAPAARGSLSTVGDLEIEARRARRRAPASRGAGSGSSPGSR